MTARVSKVLILIALAVFFYALIRLLPPGTACDPGMPRHMYMQCTGDTK
jgi:hypothetical protein